LRIDTECVLVLAPYGHFIFFVLFYRFQAGQKEIDYQRDKGEWDSDSPVYPEVRLEDK
jgi:hypothetical protein